jgi:exodeoxyribonuclease VII small subunit|tara:strand:- start:103 stop:333 length:231 start_codon:yes stop_codon:yes gene_type:complete
MSQESFNFEESMQKLVEIVKSLESENKSLEKNIQLFEEGLALSKELQKHLESAEEKIEILSKDQNGDLSAGLFEEK